MDNQVKEIIRQEIPLEVFIVISERNNKPCLEIRRVTTDNDIIKLIVSCAFHGIPIKIIPVFNNQIRSLCSLVDKGILYKEGEEFFFTI